MTAFSTFGEFWPYYLQEHTRRGTRALHYIGTSLFILVLVAEVLTGNMALLLLVPVVGYGFAWVAHLVVERNRPATFRHPLWSLLADFRMCYCFLMGSIGIELERAGIRADGSIDPRSRLG